MKYLKSNQRTKRTAHLRGVERTNLFQLIFKALFGIPDVVSVFALSRNSGVLPNNRDRRNAMAGETDLRSLGISLTVWRDNPRASASEAVVKP